MSKKQNKRSFAAGLYSNKMMMFVISLLSNILLAGLIVWLSRYAKIKGDLFAQIIGAIVIVGLSINVFFLMGYAKNIKLFRQLFFGITTLLLFFSLIGGVYIIRTEISLNNLVNQGGDETVDYSVIGFSEEYTEESMGTHRIGYLKQSEEFEELFKDKIREHSRTIQYVEFKDYNDLLAASLEGEIEYALVPRNYARLQDDYLEAEVKPFDKAHVLFTFSTVVDDDYKNVNVTKEPFSIILLGNNEGLSDSIIVATVNPQTLRITMTSLARDSYVPIACYSNQSRDKLNHSRSRGRQCLVDTVEDFLDIEIDFYFETDFYALEKIIDALGGIEIDSPITFAGSFPVENEPNEYIGVTVPKGLNLLDGKQAVTFARERSNFLDGDFARQLNQQYVIREIATKLINERNPERLVSVLEGASKNLVMNISIDDLTALLGYAINETNASPLDPLSTFRIIQTQVAGDTPTINGMSVVLPYMSDVENAHDVIVNNLSTEASLNDEREFIFTIRKPFELSKRPYTDGTTVNPGEIDEPEEIIAFEVPSFTSGYTKAEVSAWGQRKGVGINFRVIDENSPDFNPSYADGQVIHQSIDAGMYEQKPSEINISIVSKTAVEKPVEPEKPEEPETPAAPADDEQVLELPKPDSSSSLADIKAYAQRNDLPYSEVEDVNEAAGKIMYVDIKGKKGNTAGYVVVTIGSKPAQTTPTP